MPERLLPFRDVLSAIKEATNQTEAQIATLGSKRHVRLLKHTATFGEHQFGNRIAGESAYKRDNGDCIKNWDVEICILFGIYGLLEHYVSISDATMKNAIPYYEKTLALLKPWEAQIDLSERERIDDLDEEKIDMLLNMLYSTENNLIKGYGQLKNWDKAEHHCKQSIFHAKQMKGGQMRIRRVFDALSLLGDTYHLCDKLTESKAVREEAYMFVNEVYDPEHPLVLEAASNLIGTLGMTGDHYDAERFARICYQCLTRPPLDPESYEAAKAAGNLARASYNLIEANGLGSADIEEAEMLASEAVRIIRALKGPSDVNIPCFLLVLVNIRFKKKDYGEGAKSLLEDYLAHAIRDQGIDGEHTADIHDDLGHFYYQIVDTLSSSDAKRTHLQQSESHYKEALRIYTKIYGSKHQQSLALASELSLVSIELEQIINNHQSDELR
jgi:tetratricopeptide (TPR) repeat protein